MSKTVALKPVAAISNKALKEKDLPSRIKILNWGKNKTLDGDISFDEDSAKVFYANQKSIGRTLAPLDFNHNTVPGTQAYEADKEPRAIAGYGVPTIVKDDGVYLDYMHWTKSGQKSARDYADLSPAVITDGDNRVIGLHSCALTPAGAVENLSFFSADTMTGLMELAQTKVNCMNVESDDGEHPHPLGCMCEECKSERAKNTSGSLKVEGYSADKSRGNEYGDVEYADTKNKKYPINTEEHVRAAWSYIHMPRNSSGYSSKELAAIKKRISAKAKTYGIELKAESADSRVKKQVDAYVNTPYEATGIDMEIGEHLDYFRKKLGLPDDAKPDDIMKFLRAKWEGIEDDDKEVLPFKTKDASVDPSIRNDGDLTQRRPGDPKGVITFSAEDRAKMEKDLSDKFEASLTAKIGDFTSKITTLSASLDTLKSERDAKVAELEAAKRTQLIANASRDGKIIPLSDEQIGKLPVTVLEEMVNKLEPKQVNMTPRELKPLTANTRPVPWSTVDGKIPELAGAAQRASESATRFFAEHGVKSAGAKPNLSPV